MTTTTCICIVLCFLIAAVFAFFTIVYLSELKRERQMRKLMTEESDKIHALMNTKMPVVLVDLPSKAKESAPKLTLVDPSKKDIN
jgi:hypothetical protein